MNLKHVNIKLFLDLVKLNFEEAKGPVSWQGYPNPNFHLESDDKKQGERQRTSSALNLSL